jgi:hypothetical protein
MTASTLRLSDGTTVPVPRGARWVADAFTAVWSALERHGEARARRALAEAAHRYEASDPGMAADLLAAMKRDPV